jgi:hypothetical protein
MGFDDGFIAIYSQNINSVNEEYGDEDCLSINPNPASDYVEINLNSDDQTVNEILVYNELGEQVLHQNNMQLEGSSHKIVVSQLPNGSYRLVAKTSHGMFTKALVIVK